MKLLFLGMVLGAMLAGLYQIQLRRDLWLEVTQLRTERAIVLTLADAASRLGDQARLQCEVGR